MTQMLPAISIASYVSAFAASPLAAFGALAPWALAARAESIVRELLAALPAGEFMRSEEIAIHPTATVEPGDR